MRKIDCFLLALFALSVRGVQRVMLIYLASLCRVLDNLVLIIGVFFTTIYLWTGDTCVLLRCLPHIHCTILILTLIFTSWITKSMFAYKTGLEW